MESVVSVCNLSKNLFTGFNPMKTGITADLDSPLQIWTPLPNFTFKHRLVTNSIAKFFVDVLFNHNTTFLNKGKKKPAISFQFYRIYYSESYSIRKN